MFITGKKKMIFYTRVKTTLKYKNLTDARYQFSKTSFFSEQRERERET